VTRHVVSSDIRGQLLFLGTGTSIGVPVVGCGCPTCTSTDPRNARTRCSLMLGLPQGNLLVDTPPELRIQLVRERLGLVHAVLFTHAHADHLFGLDDVRLFPYYIGHPLPIYCEQEVEARIRKSFDYAFDPITREYPAGGVPQVDFHPIATEPFEVLGAPVQPIRLLHGRTQVLGFRFGNVAYCTDTNEIPAESWPLLAGLDVLILDALRHKPHPTHFSLAQSIEVAERLRPRRTIFTHLSHDLEHQATCDSLPDGMELAYDGLKLPLT
jgi:phosphoribosyl 1,2-cyclic phosphate phosphodiesterase